MTDAAAWRFAGACADGQRFELDGVNVWDCQWKQQSGSVTVRDPHYDQPHEFYVYDLVSGRRTLRVVAGEFSNGIWGFYVSQQG